MQVSAADFRGLVGWFQVNAGDFRGLIKVNHAGTRELQI